MVLSQDTEAVVALLRDNPKTPYKEIADLASISESDVRQIALERDLQRPGKRQNELSEDVKVKIRGEAQAQPIYLSDLKDLARRFGVARTALKRFLVHEQLLAKRRGPRPPKLTVDESEQIRQRIEYLQAELKKAIERQAEIEVRYERDGDNVVVFNLADRPFTVNYKKAIKWLNQPGATKLREFIGANWKEVVHMPKAS